MAINFDKIESWKADIAKSVAFYNEWFLEFAPQAYRNTRLNTANKVQDALVACNYLKDISPEYLQQNPVVLSILRMTTRPPLARDRLIGLADVSPNLVSAMEKGSIPSKMDSTLLYEQLLRIADILRRLVDTDLFPWLHESRVPSEEEKNIAAIIVADRLCGMLADPIIRNSQEQRQLKKIGEWLEQKGYTQRDSNQPATLETLAPGTFSFRFNVPVTIGTEGHKVNIPVDVAIKPKNEDMPPILIEAKSAGDFTNTNKRRKEEAVKYAQLKSTYGKDIPFLLFLCGYFDAGYLGYEAAEGIDWIWEHRMSDLEALNL